MSLNGSEPVMSNKMKSKNRTVEKEEDSIQHDQGSAEALKRVNEGPRRKYNTRAAKRLQEKQRLKRNDQLEEGKENTWQADESWQNEAKKYKESYPIFKRKMIREFGETFYYNGGSWHGKESRRYSPYHIRKSMRFLQSNMNSDDDDESDSDED